MWLDYQQRASFVPTLLPCSQNQCCEGHKQQGPPATHHFHLHLSGQVCRDLLDDSFTYFLEQQNVETQRTEAQTKWRITVLFCHLLLGTIKSQTTKPPWNNETSRQRRFISWNNNTTSKQVTLKLITKRASTYFCPNQNLTTTTTTATTTAMTTATTPSETDRPTDVQCPSIPSLEQRNKDYLSKPIVCRYQSVQPIDYRCKLLR